VMIQKLVIHISKCRNLTSAYIYGALIGLIAVYSNWCTFLYVLLQRYEETVPLTDLLLNPGKVYEMANIISIDGWYSLFGSDVSGWVLWAFWIIEIIGIILAGIIGGPSVMHETVFCEDCNRWVEDTEFDLRLSASDQSIIASALNDDISMLTDLPVSDRMETPHLRVNLHHCSQCDNLSTADIDKMTLKQNDKGEIEEDHEDFSPVIVLSKNQYQQFLAKKKEPPAISAAEQQTGSTDEQQPIAEKPEDGQS
ncbi:MAG: hypothetical protein AAFO69_11500, partial [Bacteroidota bacterium]